MYKCIRIIALEYSVLI